MTPILTLRATRSEWPIHREPAYPGVWDTTDPHRVGRATRQCLLRTRIPSIWAPPWRGSSPIGIWRRPATGCTRLTLDRLVGQLGPDMPVAAITTPILARFFATTYAHLAPASHNRVVATLGSLFAYTTRQGWTPISPAAGLERRRLRSGPRDHARTRAIPEAKLLAFLTADHPVRDKTLWWLLYESAARAGEVLALNVEDLDLAHRRAVVIGKGGRAELIGWETKTARLCPVCCTSGGKARCSWPISPPLRPASPRWPTSTPTPVGPGCLTGEPPRYSRKPPAAGHCTNCGTRG